MNIEIWLAYITTVLVLMSTPGPSQLLMLSNSIQNGFKNRWWSIFVNDIQEINCPHCGSSQLGKAGFSVKGMQRHFCKNNDCKTNTFMLEYSSKAYAVGVKKKIVEMVINGSGIRDTGYGKSTWRR